MPMSSAFAEFFSGVSENTAVIFLGDSNSVGNGQDNGYRGSLMGITTRSIMNHFDRGVGGRRGYMYETILSPYLAITGRFGITTDGEYVSGGPSGNLLKLKPGGTLQITNRLISTVSVFFDSESTDCKISIDVDGEPAYLSAAGSTCTTGRVRITKDQSCIDMNSVVTIKAIDGPLVLSGVQAVSEGGSRSPLLYSAAEGSQGFSDFTAWTDNIANTVMSECPGAKKLVVLLLGTNHMVPFAYKYGTPDQYVALLDDLVVACREKLGGDSLVRFAIWVPPKPDTKLPLATYEEYAAVIAKYCSRDNRMTCIRMDEAGVDWARFYNPKDPAPGVHFNEYGHALAARAICNTLGIRVNAEWPRTA